MHAIILAASLLCSTAALEDGTLIFLENSNKIVQLRTDSSISHVALVINDGGQSWVYEATPAKVRRVPLAQYRGEMADLKGPTKSEVRAWAMRPAKAYSPRQVAAMKNYLDEQLGRRYSIKNYVRHKQGDGIHCAELTANTLQKSGRMQFDVSYQESPASLMANVQPFYHVAQQLPLTPPPEQAWCSRAWEKWAHFRIWCGWSCYECWTFCR